MTINARKILCLLPTLACLASCMETYPSVDQMTGIIDETFTRTSFVEEGIKLKTNWEYGDYIIVKSNGNNTQDNSGEYTELDDDDMRGYSYITEYIEDNKALFASMDEKEPSAPYIAFYPREISEFYLPNSQIYQADGPYQAPMIAKAPTMYLLFKPICGAMEIKLSTTLENATVKKILLSTDQPLCGSFDMGDDYVAIASGENTLTLSCSEGVTLGSEPKSFWFSVPQNTYTGVQVEIITTDGRTQTFRLDDSASIEVVRAEITTCPLNLQILNKSTEYESAELPTGQAFNRLIKKIANPGTDYQSIETATADKNITRIEFATNDDSTEGENIMAEGEAPVYISFNSESGLMKISTPAKELRMHRDGTAMFRYLTALTEINIEALECEDLATMNYMFNHCEALTYVEMTAIPGTQVEDMDNCFSYCYALENLDFSKFSTEKLHTLRSCFRLCYQLGGKLDLSGVKSDKLVKLGYAFQSCKKLESIDISNIIPACASDNMVYMFYNLPCLKELKVNDKFIPTDKQSAQNLFAGSAETTDVRTASVPGNLTIYCSQAVADWMVITTLRWINSGYKKCTAIPVTFIDNATGSQLTVTWAAN